MEHKQSELTVITKAKDLCSYVMNVTQKSPKQFRFTFVTRLQNLALSAIENLFRANIGTDGIGHTVNIGYYHILSGSVSANGIKCILK